LTFPLTLALSREGRWKQIQVEAIDAFIFVSGWITNCKLSETRNYFVAADYRAMLQIINQAIII